VLLVSAPACFEDEFWFNFGDSTGGRSLVSGIGPDKMCLLDKDRGQAVMDKAQEYRLAVHPWTSRPEYSTLSGSSTGSSEPSSSSSAVKLESSVQELGHLFCECRATGVFAEAVATAVQVAAIGCQNWKGGAASNDTAPATLPAAPPAASPPPEGGGVDCPSSSTSASESSSSSSAPPSSAIYVPLICFALGIAVALLAVRWCNSRRGQSRSSSYRSRRQYRVGTTDEYGNNDLELT
jgi:hypothetical protein